ncbi:MAG: hypothetical protein CMF59_00890 [Leptospiraceae bacterium]|nr:hypothetical protein [Leptospiraceae bacterium]
MDVPGNVALEQFNWKCGRSKPQNLQQVSWGNGLGRLILDNAGRKTEQRRQDHTDDRGGLNRKATAAAVEKSTRADRSSGGSAVAFP